MRKTFKKILTILGGALMIGSTIGMAAAVNYPAPFGVGNTAIVYGSQLDAASATEISNNLGLLAGSGQVTVDDTAISLSSGSTKVWLNTSMNTAKTVLTKSDLPAVLDDFTFSGNVESKMTSTLSIGTNKVTFAKQPTSNVDPVIGITMGSSKTDPLYNLSVSMPAVAFNNSLSEGESITLFGNQFVVSTATDATSLVLFSSAEEVELSVGGTNPSTKTVTIGGVSYEIGLVTGSSTTSATISVNGVSKQVNAGSSKKISGVDIALKSVTESTALSKIDATILVGSEKITLTDGTSVLKGSDDDPVDGTYVRLTGGVNALTAINIAVFAPTTSEDAILAGETFTDPVFGGFSLVFKELNVPLTSADRDAIVIDRSGDKGMSLSFTDANSNEASFDFVYNASTTFLGDSSSYRIAVREGATLYQSNYTTIGNEEYGHLLQLTRIYNFTGTDFTKDAVTFKDVITDDTYNMDATSEGEGRLTISGRQYTVTYKGTGETGTVTLKYPTSESASTGWVMFPTIETKGGALIGFYEPQTINMSNMAGGTTSATTTLVFPDGDGYTSFTATGLTNSTGLHTNWTIDSTIIYTGTNPGNGAVFADQSLTVGQLTYSINGTTSNNQTKVYLNNPSTGVQINGPAIVIFEGKNNSNLYNTIVIDVEANSAGSSTDPVGVNDVYFTSGVWDSVSLQSDSDISQSVDTFGTLVIEDGNTASQKVVTINYPEEQVYADLYVASSGAVISDGSIGAPVILDSEVSTSGADKNLIVVGGSCVNTLAAELLTSGAASCEGAFTTATGVSAGQYLIQSFSRSGKIATVIAGYDVTDTAKAADHLINLKPSTDVATGKKIFATANSQEVTQIA